MSCAAATRTAREARTMREALQAYLGRRITISGRVQRFGTRLGWNGSKLPALLVGPVLDAQGAEITDHPWLRVGQRIALADPQPGDVLTLAGCASTPSAVSRLVLGRWS
jgi:hypothetical protein